MNLNPYFFLKTIALLFCFSLFINACKKHKNEDNNNVVIPTADTLSAGWTKVGNIPSAETVTDVLFTDLSNGYITTYTGVYKSTDGGSNWTKIISGGSFINIAAHGSNACFVNRSDTIFTTLDYGASFSKRKYNTYRELPLTFEDCFYSSDDICYAVSDKYIWKSTDAGITFDTLYNSLQGAHAIASMYFVNDTHGWVAMGAELLRTTNGGVSWTHVVGNSDTYIPLSFLDENNGFWADHIGIIKTTNGGSNWQQYPYIYPPGNKDIDDIQFFTTLKGICAAQTHIFRTNDGGNTWTNEVSLGGKYFIEVHFLDEHNGWACGSDGYVLRFNQ